MRVPNIHVHDNISFKSMEEKSKKKNDWNVAVKGE